MNNINLNKELNVVYIGPDTFPLGAATTKRRRYMVDYMNSQVIQSHVLVTRSAKLDKENDIDGQYGLCDYHNISHHFHSSYYSYLKAGKRWLKQWRDDRKKYTDFSNNIGCSRLSFFFVCKEIRLQDCF